MTSDRLRVTSSIKSAIQGLALAVACATLILRSLSAEAADLVVWWEKGQYEEEDEAIREVIAAFEHDSGKRGELKHELKV